MSLTVTEMRMLKWISGNTRKDEIPNEEIHLKTRVAPIDEKTRKSHLRWFGCVEKCN